MQEGSILLQMEEKSQRPNLQDAQICKIHKYNILKCNSLGFEFVCSFNSESLTITINYVYSYSSKFSAAAAAAAVLDIPY